MVKHDQNACQRAMDRSQRAWKCLKRALSALQRGPIRFRHG